MAKVYYVVKKDDDSANAHFFKSEKEAAAYGTSEFPDFKMGEESTEDEENGGWYTGSELTFKKGFLFMMEEGDWSIQDMDDKEARIEVEGKENFGAIYFDGFKQGAYGYLGNGADGKNYAWSADDDGIQEATKYVMKHIKLFEEFVNEAKIFESTRDNHYKYDFTPQLGTGDHLGRKNELKKGHEFWPEVEAILKDVPKAADATTLAELKRVFGKAEVIDGKLTGNATSTVILDLGETPGGFPIHAAITPLKYHLFYTNEYSTFKGDFKVKSIYCTTPGNFDIELMSLDHDHIDGKFRGYGYMEYGDGFPAPSNWKGAYVDKLPK